MFDLGHVPQLTDFDSLLNLLAFCNLLVMANVLDFRTYEKSPRESDSVKHDTNAIPAKERYEMAYARGRCWEIILWVFHVYEVFDKETGEAIEGFTKVAMSYLAHLGSTIIEFKRRSVESHMDDEESLFTVKDLARQFRLCFQFYNDIPTIQQADKKGVASLDFPERDRYGLRASVSSVPFKCKHVP